MTLTSDELVAVHAEQRAKERYGIDLSDADRADMVDQVRDGRGLFFKKKTGSAKVSIWLVWWAGASRIVPIYYKSGRVLTVLPTDAFFGPPQSHARAGLFDGNASMADGGEATMTAAEEVLAWLLTEKIGLPDNVSYSPDQAQKIIVQNLDQAAKQLVDGGELLLQAESVITDLTKLLQTAKEVIACASDTYKKRNGHLASFEDDSGEKCWIVPFDAFEGLRSAVSALATMEGSTDG